MACVCVCVLHLCQKLARLLISRPKEKVAAGGKKIQLTNSLLSSGSERLRNSRQKQSEPAGITTAAAGKELQETRPFSGSRYCSPGLHHLYYNGNQEAVINPLLYRGNQFTARAGEEEQRCCGLAQANTTTTTTTKARAATLFHANSRNGRRTEETPTP